MAIYSYIKLTLKILRRRRIYTAVTLVGIIIPVTFIVLVTSFLVRLNNYESPRSEFRNVVYLDKVIWKEHREGAPEGEYNQWMENPPTLSFIRKHVEPLRVPVRVGYMSELFGSDQILYRGSEGWKVEVKYTDPVFWEITDFQFLQGRPFAAAEFDQAERLMVIDKQSSLDLFGTTDCLGEEIQMGNKSYRVCGVIENVDRTMYRLHANLYLPYSTLDTYDSDGFYDNMSIALIQLNSPDDFDKVQSEFQRSLQDVTFENTDCNEMEAAIARDNYLSRAGDLIAQQFHYYGSLTKPLILFSLVLVFFLVVLPVTNLVNININRVYERLSEIGVRKTFGATIRTLTRQFLFENIFITLLGGVLALGLTAFILNILNRTEALPGLTIRINLASFGVSLLAILLIGILSGLLPSRKMARSRIIHCLHPQE
ncbi:MAG: ABC transporter permease [Bacteroidales bacterium]